jgi:CheY-like chemotaxis protein
MPNLDGFATTSQIRQTNLYTPIIATTSTVPSPNEVAVHKEHGMNDTLRKPFTKESLESMVDVSSCFAMHPTVLTHLCITRSTLRKQGGPRKQCKLLVLWMTSSLCSIPECWVLRVSGYHLQDNIASSPEGRSLIYDFGAARCISQQILLQRSRRRNKGTLPCSRARQPQCHCKPYKNVTVSGLSRW